MEEASHYPKSELPAPETGTAEAAAERLTPALDRIYEQIERVQVELPKTEEVLHKVVEAAEHNQAIEKLFELRHEAKDLPNTDEQVGGAAAAALSQQPGPMLGTPPAHVLQKASQGIATLLPPKNSLYGQAVRYGFISALFALSLATVLVLLFT